MDTTPIPQTTQPGAPAPKKYIRTFAGDMEMFKKGDTPDLKPFEPLPPQEVQPAAIAEEKPAPIKTYAGDFSQRMKDTHASTATVLATEQDAAPLRASQTPPEGLSRNTILSLIVGVVLFILGIVGSYIAYVRYMTNVEPVILAPTIATPIFVDEKEKISGTNSKEILQAIGQSVTRQLVPGTVRFLYTDFATTTHNNVFLTLQLPVPNALFRNVNAAYSMDGIVNAGGSQNSFFILSVASYGDTFASMLLWEPTMVLDLSALFPPHPQLSVLTVSTSSTPSAKLGTGPLTTGNSPQATATSTPFIKFDKLTAGKLEFRDEVVSNHDVRVYRDADGRSVLLYGYWNQTTLVIARDPAAFIEIIGRLATTRTQS